MTAASITQITSNNTWSYRLSSWINPYHDLEMRIRSIAAESLTNLQKTDLQAAFKLAHGWTWPAGRMKALLQTIPAQYIEQLIKELLQNENEKELTKLLNRYLSFLNQTSLLELSGLMTQENAANWFQSRGLIKDSLLNSRLEKEGRAIFKEIGIEMKYFLHHFLDILIGLLGINELSQNKSNRRSNEERMDEYTAMYKLEAYGRLLGYPALLFGLIYTNVQFKAIAITLTTLAITAILVCLIGYQRYLKPCPKEQHGMENLMIERLNPSKAWTYARHEILREIEKALMEEKGVILVGESGAGKSSIAPSMADKIAEGSMCGFIKDPQLFSCGASKFRSQSFENPSLYSIMERFKNYPHQVIFFLDEFHAFFTIDGNSKTNKAEDIKVFCDKFKHVIGTTTTKEYEEHIKNQIAIIGRRFVVIHVGSMEDKSLKIMLSQFLQAKHPSINLEDQALEYLIAKASDFNSKTSKMDAAQTLLNRAIKEIDTIEFKELQSQIYGLVAEKDLIKQNLSHAKMGKDDGLMKDLEAKEAEIVRLEAVLMQKNQQVERMRKIEAYYLKLKEQSFRMADPNIQLTSQPRLEQQWIELQAKIKVVGDFIENKRKELNLPVGLTKELIDKILKERK